MISTYCEITGNGKYAIHVNQDELGLIADLLNSVNDLRAVPLRQAVDKEIRAQNTFTILRQIKIVQCDYCKGAGYVNYYDDFNQIYKKERCPECAGKCQKVEITVTRFERLTPYWKNELAPVF